MQHLLCVTLVLWSQENKSQDWNTREWVRYVQAGEIGMKKKILHGSSALILYCHRLIPDAFISDRLQSWSLSVSCKTDHFVIWNADWYFRSFLLFSKGKYAYYRRSKQNFYKWQLTEDAQGRKSPVSFYNPGKSNWGDVLLALASPLTLEASSAWCSRVQS